MIDLSECIKAKRLGAKGYGVIRHLGKTVLAHRLSYCQHHGLNLSDIDGVLIRHKCDNPPCINPDHLEPGTHKDNSRDMVERGRAYRWVGLRDGEKNPRCKLTKPEVDAIRARYKKYSSKDGLKSIARDYGVHFLTIFCIVSGRNWKL